MSDPAEPPAQEPKMDIRKPRPWHGVRGFLKEVGIIVLGVGLALAAQLGIRPVPVTQARIAACNQASARKF